MKKISLVAIAAIVLISGCSLAPTYERPAMPAAPAWPQGPAYGVDRQRTTQSAADIGWRDFFADPTLQTLIEQALDHNRDLRVALLNVEAARAQYRIQRADLLPGVDASGSGNVQGNPDEVRVPGQDSVNRQYSVSIGITAYELDVFGRIRSLNRQALENYMGLEQTRRSAQISLVAEVANRYLALLADQALLKLTQETLDSRSESFRLSQLRFDSGRSSELDLRQAESALESARADLARYTRFAAQDRNALLLLVGTPLDPSVADNADFNAEHLLQELPEGLPSDLLTRRPDILAAEHDLLASNASIGAARAAFFPSISLTGTYGTTSRELSGLFGSGSQSWSFAPQITLPIFAGGANRANLDLAKVQKRIEIAQYEKSIQTAFREVADALAARGTYQQQLAAQRAVVHAGSESLRLSELRYRNGRDSYLNVLDSQRTLFMAQQNLIGDELDRLQNLIALYKALGGGWDETSVVATTQP